MASNVNDAIIVAGDIEVQHMDQGQPIYIAMYPYSAGLAVNNWVIEFTGLGRVNSFCFLYSGLFNHVKSVIFIIAS